MKQILLKSKNPNAPKFALVDDEDFEYLNQWEWSVYKDHHTWYVVRHVIMHRLIMNENSSIKIDHKDGNGLNNQRSNLRIATNQQNQGNRRKNKNNKSGYKGVSLIKNHFRTKPWQAIIGVDNKQIYLGVYSTAEEAAKAYDKAAKHYFGEFANLNFKKD